MILTNKYERHCKKAQKYLEKYEFAKAKKEYLECLSIKPNDMATLNNLAQIHSILNEKDKAKGYSEILLEECDKQTDSMEKDELLILKINALFSLKRRDEADKIVDELLRICPDSSIALFYKVSYLDEKERYKESLTYIDKILVQDPYNVQVLLIKSRTLIELKEYEKAERFCNRVFEIEPKNKDAISLKSEVLKKRFKITLTPHDLVLKAINYWHIHEYESAEGYFEKALAINQKYDEIWFNQGGLFIQMGKIKKAKQSFEKAFELNPRSGGVTQQKRLFRMLKVMGIINKIFGKKE